MEGIFVFIKFPVRRGFIAFHLHRNLFSYAYQVSQKSGKYSILIKYEKFMIDFHKRKDIFMKRASLSPEDQVRSIHFKYEIPEDRVQAALDRGFRFGDVDQAALLSCLSDASMEDILAMRKDDPWGVIKKKLGLTAAVYEKTYLLHRAERLERFYGISAQRALTLLEEGYPNHWIRLAYLLEQHTGVKTEDIVHSRKKSEKWKPWAERVLHVSPEDFTAWIAETRNPSLARKK